jgi:hypothetical protein
MTWCRWSRRFSAKAVLRNLSFPGSGVAPGGARPLMVTRVAISLYPRQTIGALLQHRARPRPPHARGNRQGTQRFQLSARAPPDLLPNAPRFQAEATGALGARDRSCMSAPPWLMRFICAPRSRDKCPAARPIAVVRPRRAQRNTDLSFEHSRVETVRPLRRLEA